MPAGSHGPTHGPEVASEPGPRSYQDGEARAFAALLRQSPASLSATWLNSRQMWRMEQAQPAWVSCSHRS